jgi:hypothetical protein
MSIAIKALARNAESIARVKNLRLCQKSCKYGSSLIGSSRSSTKRDFPGAPFLSISGAISGAGTLPVELNSAFPQFQYWMSHDGTMAERFFAAESECQSKRKRRVAVRALL